jgi:hypothetical protein
MDVSPLELHKFRIWIPLTATYTLLFGISAMTARKERAAQEAVIQNLRAEGQALPKRLAVTSSILCVLVFNG